MSIFDSRGKDGPIPAAHLIREARRHVRQERQPFIEVFKRATVHYEWSEHDHSVRRHARSDGTVWVHAYSTRDRLPGAELLDVPVKAINGADLLGQIPGGVGVVLDPGWNSEVTVTEASPATQPIPAVSDHDGPEQGEPPRGVADGSAPDQDAP